MVHVLIGDPVVCHESRFLAFVPTSATLSRQLPKGFMAEGPLM